MGNTTDALNTLFDVPAVVTDVVPIISLDEPLSANAEMIVYSENPVAVVPNTDQDQTDDYNFARDTVREMITRAKETLDGILEVARESETPRSYEVASNLIKTISEVTKDLVNLHKTMNDLKPKGEMPPPGATNIIDKAVFVGHPQDLLDAVKYNKH